MMKTKQSLSLLLVCALLWGMTGCAASPAEKDTDTYSPPANLTETAEHPCYDAVAAALNRTSFTETAKPLVALNPHFTAGGNITSGYDISPSHLTALLCMERAANPLSVFRAVIRDGIYENTTSPQQDRWELEFDGACDYGGHYRLDAVTKSIQPKAYPFSRHGCKSLLDDVMTLCTVNGKDSILTNAYAACNPQTLSYSYEDACYYTYLIYYGESETFLLNWYFRSDDGLDITDVAFDLIETRYVLGGAAGCSISMAHQRHRHAVEAAALIATLEKVMTNQSVFSSLKEGELITERTITSEENNHSLPCRYPLGDHTATLQIERYSVPLYDSYKSAGGGDHCDIYSFRLRR